MGKGKRICSVVLAVMLLLCTVSLVSFGGEENAADAAVVKRGNRGQNVRTVQSALKKYGYYKGNVDGIFGAQTYEAVKYFQRKNGLSVDGIVGKKTAAALGISLSSGSGSVSSSDLNLLARAVYGEARGESYTGKVAVAAVILNRVKSSKFPNTIAGVIYQPYAFTAVADGQINLTPNTECYNAAKDALAGWDPTYGCLYYYNPKTATSKWIFTTKTVVTIGNHVFSI